MTTEQLQTIITANTTDTGSIDYDQIGREVVWMMEVQL